MSLVDSNNDVCLTLDDVDMYTFSQATGQWLPPPKNPCWRQGLVIKHRIPHTIRESFTVTMTGRRLVCADAHIKVMTRMADSSECGLVSGNYQICKQNGFIEGGVTTCYAACHFKVNKPKYIIVEIPKKHEGWEICEISVK